MTPTPIVQRLAIYKVTDRRKKTPRPPTLRQAEKKGQGPRRGLRLGVRQP